MRTGTSSSMRRPARRLCPAFNPCPPGHTYSRARLSACTDSLLLSGLGSCGGRPGRTGVGAKNGNNYSRLVSGNSRRCAGSSSANTRIATNAALQSHQQPSRTLNRSLATQSGQLPRMASSYATPVCLARVRGFPPRCGHTFLCGGGQRSRSLLVLDRADLTDSGVPPSGVVTSDPMEHRSARLTRAVPALLALQCLPLQRCVERLRSSVVRARSDRTPRSGDTQLTAHIGELRRDVLSLMSE